MCRSGTSTRQWLKEDDDGEQHPVMCACMGLSPYKIDILSAVTSALSYDFKRCFGGTPSVQALS